MLGLLGVGLTLAYNAVVTGSPWLFPYQAFAPLDGLGFGHREILAHDVDYTPALALRANAEVLRLFFAEWIAGGLLGAALAAVGLATPLYRSGSKLYPCHTHLFTPPASKIKIPKGYFETLDGLIDYAEVREAMRPFALEGQIVLDPCCGLGNSARIAVEHGMTFFGNELNAARLAKTEKILRRAVR